MSTEPTPSGAILVTGPAIADARLITLKHARRGSSAYAILKREYGYKGDKRAVLAAVSADVEKMLCRGLTPDPG